MARAEDTFGLDPAVGFVAPRDGRYVVSVQHVASAGAPQFVYRLTLAATPLAEAVYPAGGQRGAAPTLSFFSSAFPASGPGLGRQEHAVRLDPPPGGQSVQAACRASR